MPRYVDADELWLQLDKRKSFEQGRNRAYYKGLRDAKKVLEDTLTADVIEVVRCQDCKFSEEIGPGLYICHNENIKIVGSYVEPDWYCADGK